MKQCPNPNCILYTRLEELPDAYVKCPGCGGLLVSSEDPQSQQLLSGHLSDPPTRRSPIVTPDPDALSAPPVQAAATPVSPYSGYDDDSGFIDPYAAGVEQGPDSQRFSQAYSTTSGFGSSQWSAASKVAFAIGSVLLLVACGLLAWIISSQLFPQARTVASPAATQTALALVLPPVNTPLPTQPTVTGTGAGDTGPAFNPTPAIPTSYVPPPTTVAANLPPTQPVAQVPPTNVPPAQPGPATATPPLLAQVPTAPPAQQQPSNGVLDAHMSPSLQGGEPQGSTDIYAASDPFNLAVQANFGPDAVTSVLTRWYGPDGALIYSMQKQYTLPGTYYIGFTISKNGPWTPGTYRVDIHTNNSPTPSYSVTFAVN